MRRRFKIPGRMAQSQDARDVAADLLAETTSIGEILVRLHPYMHAIRRANQLGKQDRTVTG
jgi:hypothetical protein